MKFFVAFVALVAVAAAGPLTKPVDVDLAQLEAIIAAINSPSTDPATAALLEEQLHDIINAVNPIAVGPALIPLPEVVDKPEPIAVGPAWIDFPVPDLGAVTAPVAPSPVVVGAIPAGAPSPLVQIIVNVNKASADVSPIAVGPVITPEPVHVVEVAPEPVQVVEVAPEPVQVIEVAPVPVEPVQIGVPVIPEPVVILPEELN